MRYVIVGASAAGLAAAEAICSVDPSAEVTLLTEEPHSPYCRPLISYALAGEVPETLYPLPPPSKGSVRLRTGERAVGLDPEKRALRLASGDALAYDRLLLATGAASKPLGIPGEDAPNVFGFRTRADAEAIGREIAGGARRAAVLGGGLVGVKAAHSLAARGLEVTLCIGSGAPLSQVVNPEAGRRVAKALEAEGVRVRTGLRPVEIARTDGRATGVRFQGGEELPCDLVVRGKGVDPRVELLTALGVNARGGAPVDDRLRTAVPNVWAAGDAVRAFDVVWEEPRLNAIWPAAVEQGTTAGRNMAGSDEPYPGNLARNSVKIGPRHLVSAGIARPPDGPYEVRETEDPAGGYRRVVLRQGRLVGFVAWGPDGSAPTSRAGIVIAAIRRGASLAELPFDPLRDPIGWGGFAFPLGTPPSPSIHGR